MIYAVIEVRNNSNPVYIGAPCFSLGEVRELIAAHAYSCARTHNIYTSNGMIVEGYDEIDRLIVRWLVMNEGEDIFADDDEYIEPPDIDDDFGFDPYEGCYTYDC